MRNQVQRAACIFLRWLFERPLSAALFALGLLSSGWSVIHFCSPSHSTDSKSTLAPEFGYLPRPNDSFHFIPCTSKTLLPDLDDPDPLDSWTRLYDSDPSHWNWGAEVKGPLGDDTYAGRGIYLCGYLDVPLDYTNVSDHRITRLAVTKYQVSGLQRIERKEANADDLYQPPTQKSERTIVVNPGGPGTSGTRYVWRNAEMLTNWLSDGLYDVLGWDPRGVNASLPALACFPHNVNRDHWTLAIDQYLEASPAPRAQLELMGAFHDATFMACRDMYGDFPRFVGTAFVARDVEQIRLALDEEELTAYFASYGTGIGQIYANMYPDRVGRIVMDGVQNTRDQRSLVGFGQAALSNVTDAWRDGFLRECIESGPENCALARSDHTVILNDLQYRMETTIVSLIDHPLPAFAEATGPTVITYSALALAIYVALYNPERWPRLAEILYDLEQGNRTLIGEYLEEGSWTWEPLPLAAVYKSSTVELSSMVICGDSADAPIPPGGLDWWLSQWEQMSTESWIGGSPRFWTNLPCRHFQEYWPQPPELYRGDLNAALKHPVLLISATHDPATPLDNGKRLAKEMGSNARLVVHHGYGHTSQDRSERTDTIAADLIRFGKVPEDLETHCFADSKPFSR